MAQDSQPRVAQQVATPQQLASPTAREMRAQAVHRLQMGLFGLCAMLLLVGLANIIMDRARLAEQENPVAEVQATSSETKKKAATDPLADIACLQQVRGVVKAGVPVALD